MVASLFVALKEPRGGESGAWNGAIGKHTTQKRACLFQRWWGVGKLGTTMLRCHRSPLSRRSGPAAAEAGVMTVAGVMMSRAGALGSRLPTRAL